MMQNGGYLNGRAPLKTEVVVCTYNGSRYIAKQLETIMRQSCPPDSVSIYDDCSVDDTVLEIHNFLAMHPNLQGHWKVVVNPINLGYVKNFESGLRKAEGDIVFFSDQDDIWEIRKIERFVEMFRAEQTLAVFSDGALIDGEGCPTTPASVLDRLGLDENARRNFSRVAFCTLLKMNFVSGAAMAVRRRAACEMLPIPQSFPHDYWLALRLSASGDFACINEKLFSYRQHGGNLIGLAANVNWFRELLAIWRNPGAPRIKDKERTDALVLSLSDHEDCRAIAVDKQIWLQGILCGSLLSRVSKIILSLALGKYRDYAPPQAALRDIIFALRQRVAGD